MAKVKAKKRRMTRKELKRPDAVLSTMEQAVQWMAEHRRAILIGVIVAVAGAALWGVYRWRTDSQARKAAQLYKRGMRTYTALIDPAATGATRPGAQGQSYKTKEDRARAALKIFNQVVSRFEGYPISRAAHLYRGNCLFDLKKYGDAATAFKKVLATSGGSGCGGAQESSDSLKALALENLGYAQAAKGRLNEAARTFARLRSVDKGSRRDWAYYHEALILERKGDLTGAIQVYEKVRQTDRSAKGGNPDLTFMLSPLSELSTKRARYLKSKLEDRGTPPPKRRPGMGAPRPDAMEPASAMDVMEPAEAMEPMEPVEAMEPASAMGVMRPAPPVGVMRPAPAMGVMRPAPAMGVMRPAPAMARP